MLPSEISIKRPYLHAWNLGEEENDYPNKKPTYLTQGLAFPLHKSLTETTAPPNLPVPSPNCEAPDLSHLSPLVNSLQASSVTSLRTPKKGIENTLSKDCHLPSLQSLDFTDGVQYQQSVWQKSEPDDLFVQSIFHSNPAIDVDQASSYQLLPGSYTYDASFLWPPLQALDPSHLATTDASTLRIESVSPSSAETRLSSCGSLSPIEADLPVIISEKKNPTIICLGTVSSACQIKYQED